MKLNEIISKVSAELNLPEDLVKSTYSEYWNYIKSIIEKLPLKEDISQDEFSKLRTSINIPSLGKLNCTYRRYLGIKSRFNIVKKLRNNHEYKEN